MLDVIFQLFDWSNCPRTTEDFHGNGLKIPTDLGAEREGTKLQNCCVAGVPEELNQVAVTNPRGSLTK